MAGCGQVHWERQQKKLHTHRGAGSLFPYLFVFKKKPSVFSTIVPKEFANNDAVLLSSLDFLPFSFLPCLCNYMLSKSQSATAAHVVEPTTQRHPGDKAEGRDLG